MTAINEPMGNLSNATMINKSVIKKANYMVKKSSMNRADLV